MKIIRAEAKQADLIAPNGSPIKLRYPLQFQNHLFWKI
jgi:hypothetical protein